MSGPQPLLDTFLVTLRAPWSVRPSALGLEVTVVACGVLALLHALRERRRGDGVPLFTWGASFTYGIVMEVVSYNFIKSFAHGPFCVMFYRSQLPLYVVTVYPVLQYTGIMAARRLRGGIVAQAFTAGLFIVAMDIPFDILGPTQGWWSWSDTDPNIAARWYGVPVTSYYWHLAFGGILAALTRALGRRDGGPLSRWGRKRPHTPAPQSGALRAVALALPVSVLTIVLGVISFLPFHFLKARGVPDGAIVAGLVVVAGLAAALSRRAPTAAAPGPILLAIPVLFYAYHLVVALALLAAGPAAFAGQAAVIVTVTALALLAHRHVPRGAAAAPGPERARLQAE